MNKISSYLDFDASRCKIKCMMQRSSCLERFEVSIEASMVSGVQGLHPKDNFQPFIGLVGMKECIDGVSKDPRDLACLS